MRNRRAAVGLIWPLVVLAAGAAVSAVLITTAPEAKPTPEKTEAKIVQTRAVSPRSEPIAVHAYGTVIPARQVTIRPEVRGLVIAQHPELALGGFLRAGEEVLKINPADYEQALVERQTALAEAEYELDVERGRQVVASREWKLLGDDLPEGDANRSLVLREPHLKRAEALIRRAESQIAIAQLNLERTSIVAPFNAMVLDESVETGQLVEPGTVVATLVGTDEFWVQASVPTDQLHHIRLPRDGEPGAQASVFLELGEGRQVEHRGRVLRLLSDLEPSGRMARVLVSIPDPLGLETTERSTPLLLGSYVRVEIDAGSLDGVLAIDRAALRKGGQIWVSSNGELQIRDVSVLWQRPDSVLISDCLRPGEELIVSGLPSALPGLKVDPRPVAPVGIETAQASLPRTAR